MNPHSSKIEVLWSPNKEDEFATYGHELKLYSLQHIGSQATPTGTHHATPPQSMSSTNVLLDEQNYGRLIGTLSSDIQCMPIHQCVAWQQNEKRPYYFAIGQSSGKAVLTNLGLDQSSLISSMNHILSPRNGRPCMCLSWNPYDSNLLAEGLERARNECSLIIWDVTRSSSDIHTPSHSSSSRLNLNTLRSFAGGTDSSVSMGTSDSARRFEVGAGESTSSLAWLPNNSSCLIAGMGNKYLRLFDIRESERHNSSGHLRGVVNHKAISGICLDPLSPHTLATFAEGGSVYIWDIRQFNRPAYSFTRNGNILRLAWVPTRPCCLSIVLSEAPYLRIIDLPSATYSQDLPDSSELYMEHLTQRVADRCPYYKKSKDYSKLIGVSWHSKWENVCLLATAEGKVKKLDIHDKIPLSWCPTQDLVYSSSLCGLKIMTKDPTGFNKSVDEDISVKMRRRVKEGYSFDPEANAKLFSDDKLLEEVWKWLKLNQELTSKGVLTQNKTTKTIPGISSVLGAEEPLADGASPSHISKRIGFQERSTSPPKELPPFNKYFSNERNIALQLCGWNFCIDPSYTLEDFLKREEMNEGFERAAAISVFQLNIRRGIMSLKDGAAVALQNGNKAKSTQLNLIALALSGYTPQEKKLWHETCAGIKEQISHSYLKAAFVFLCSSGRDGFADVLACDMYLQDCVALACTYLDDRQLHNYITKLTRKVVDKGDIRGLFLTGLTQSGVQLLTNFVNKTGDVQTASLIAGQVMTFAIKNKQVQAWFQGYRDLLDTWQLWHERALFDGQRKKLDQTFKPSRQAFVMCGFCSKSIACDSLRHDRRSAYHSSSEQRTPTSCPNCRKPLPRCSLCLLNMVASGNKPGLLKDSPVAMKTSPDQFGQWFTWCQSCRHGGHAHHIAEWFSHHSECPVTGCSCNCFSLDSTL